MNFQSKLLAAEVSGKLALDRGIAIHAIMPIDIKEPADRVKNVVGELTEHLSGFLVANNK